MGQGAQGLVPGALCSAGPRAGRNLPGRGIPKGAFRGFSKGLVPVLARFVARGLFSSVSPDGLVPGVGGAGHAPGTDTTGQLAQLDKRSNRDSRERAGQGETTGKRGP